MNHLCTVGLKKVNVMFYLTLVAEEQMGLTNVDQLN
jgi:hypothetical protein